MVGSDIATRALGVRGYKHRQMIDCPRWCEGLRLFTPAGKLSLWFWSSCTSDSVLISPFKHRHRSTRVFPRSGVNLPWPRDATVLSLNKSSAFVFPLSPVCCLVAVFPVSVGFVLRIKLCRTCSESCYISVNNMWRNTIRTLTFSSVTVESVDLCWTSQRVISSSCHIIVLQDSGCQSSFCVWHFRWWNCGWFVCSVAAASCHRHLFICKCVQFFYIEQID